MESSSTCPFKKEVCLDDDRFTIKLDTGLLDSQQHLGINTRDEYRLQYRKVATCAPLKTAPFSSTIKTTLPNGLDGVIQAYYYGETVGFRTIGENFTHFYNIIAGLGQFGYMVE